MTQASIGHSGYVGSTLLRQTRFDAMYRSTDIANIRGTTHELVVCCGAPAQKWIANRDPEGDRRKIEGLMEHLSTIRCQRFVLISTVDVFQTPQGGLHRRMLEKFVTETFSDHLIARLPGLVGPGLRKNVIFDFLNDNNLQQIDSRGVFQFYPMVNLWHDLQVAQTHKLNLLHLTAEPISVADVALQGFGREFRNELANPPARYDMRTRHASLFGQAGHYQYSARDTLLAIRAFAQSEPLTAPTP
jgi:hypothetical protein